MRTIVVRTLAVSLVTLGVVVGAAAQNAAPADLLTSSRVQELVATAESPGDHLQLQRHFAALAARYDADARQHTTMARLYGGNPNRRANTAGPAHCKRLAQLANESASALRELAAHHEALAAGLPSTPPPAGAAFERGAGTTDLLSDVQAQELAAGARTPGEHAQLQKHFAALAAQYTADADRHARMARGYSGNPNRRTHAGAARHCERLARLARESATAAHALAAEHEDMARAASNQ
jgi:arginine/lysine/ornithine decarboxylase